MKKHSLEFILLFIFFVIESLLFLFSSLKLIDLAMSSVTSGVTVMILLLCYGREYIKTRPHLILKKNNFYRALFIILCGILFLFTAYLIAGGINAIIFPFFATGFMIVLFSALESIGLVKTYEGQTIEELDMPEIKRDIRNIIRLICIIWAVFLLSGSILYSKFPDFFLSLREVEFPFSRPDMVIADSKGNIYVDIGLYGRIQKYDKKGNFLSGFGYGKTGGSEVIIDCNDRLYVGTYHKNNLLKIYDSEGKKIKELSAPGEDITSWYLNKDGEAELKPDNKIIMNPTAFSVKEERYIFTSSRFYEKIFKDKKGKRYRVESNLFYPLVYRENSAGERDLIITPGILSYLFTIPFPGLVLPLIIILFTSLIKEKRQYNPSVAEDLKKEEKKPAVPEKEEENE